jgi:hypothetical protein
VSRGPPFQLLDAARSDRRLARRTARAWPACGSLPTTFKGATLRGMSARRLETWCVGCALVLSLASCKPKLHEAVVIEKVRESLASGGTFSAGGCTAFCGPFDVQIRSMASDAYTGVVHVRGTSCDTCDEDMDFTMAPIDPPAGHRARGKAELDPARWSLRLVSRKPAAPKSDEQRSDELEHEKNLERAREQMQRERGRRD